MPGLADLRDEAARQLSVCNACRFCEGYCAVFPALTKRPLLTSGDVAYLANLCHDCRACSQACMYTPPHEYAVDIPLLLYEARTATFADFARPGPVGRLVTASGPAAAGATGLGIVLGLAAVAALGNLGTLTSTETGPGSFYRVLPFYLMLLPSLAAAVFVAVTLAAAAVLFWRSAGAGQHRLTAAALAGAAVDALTLRYLAGGGDDCYYPDAGHPGPWRRWLHALVFYGFFADLASTVVAAYEQDVLRVMPPYPVVSLPVILGAAGGLAIVAGTTGLLALKARSATNLAGRAMLEMDVAFLLLLDLAAATGMLLLAFRGTPAMGLLLVLHLGVLAGLYATAPYGKFAHSVHRFAALVVNRLEA